ncbi:cholesterol 7-desaturase nvd [Ixodes scapularis]|uniref:cholesterol 7-desaturase nvd n=1 Tax=Ixodes scapularis TaxID=6945 RepID=UPI001C38EE84|nr:cholesterol 7-desaturase nvd [Ixodes scapularis]
MDAYCPHLGANLGVMGRVVGDCIECPFHGWRFRGEDGVCTHVPYASKGVIFILQTWSCTRLLQIQRFVAFLPPPAFVKAKTWISKEVYGLLLAWYHADGEKPTWDVNEPDEITSGRWRRTALYEKQIHGIMQDIAENGADVNHFSHVHKASAFAGPKEYQRFASTSWLRRAMTFEFDVKWSEHDFKVLVSMDNRVKIFGWTALSTHTDLWQLGPALTVAQTTSSFGNLFYVISLTPRGPLDISTVIQTYDGRSLFWPIRRLMESATSTIVDQDTLIWDHKTFLKNPGLVKEDSAIKTFREWYAQFYSSKSLTWRDVKEKTLLW